MHFCQWIALAIGEKCPKIFYEIKKLSCNGHWLLIDIQEFFFILFFDIKIIREKQINLTQMEFREEMQDNME
jgi:hypothetical protein